jgi:rubrerythrin
MSGKFTVDEVFEMAEQIERNGARFYRKAAERLGDQAPRDLLLELAAQEDLHEKTFAQIRSRVGKGGGAQPDFEGRETLYLHAVADGYVFDTRTDPSELFEGNPTPQDVLQTALEAERNSILLYVGLKETGVPASDADAIDRIIAEEMKHLARITAELAKFGQ